VPARNLIAFLDIADRLDDETWQYHARRGDFSNWIRGAIGDRELADDVAAIEARNHLPAKDSRLLVREAIERRYTLPV
jgi:hypothetical protein